MADGCLWSQHNLDMWASRARAMARVRVRAGARADDRARARARASGRAGGLGSGLRLGLDRAGAASLPTSGSCLHLARAAGSPP